MNSRWVVVVRYGLPVGSLTVSARVMSSTWNSNLPSRTAEPAGAAFGVDGTTADGAAATDADTAARTTSRRAAQSSTGCAAPRVRNNPHAIGAGRQPDGVADASV